ncbi:microtubule-associated protein 9 [Protopterus annectens]|uniref:microtubule-associated protein 9 n=1 Tax=Protopterus annectens TaxID=7888 RepID=UPI001CF9C84C|nr:microtubule-associated protein 9 [Protopterus annectens]
MTSEKAFSTGLTYTKSPKVSKRTTFQDELQEAISARKTKWKEAALNKYSDAEDDFEDSDDDDFLKKLLASRKEQKSKEKKNSTFFPLSDDESEKPKKVSFLKSDRKIHATANDDTDERDLKTMLNINAESGKSLVNGLRFSSTVQKPEAKSKREDEDKMQPTPKPRPRSTPSPDDRNFSPASNEHPKPMPCQRSLLRSSNEEEDERASSSRPSSLFSRSLSTTEINRRSPFSERTYSKSPSPERSGSTSPTAKPRARLERAASSFFAERLTYSLENRSKESSPTRDQEYLFSGADVKKTPSLMDLMTATGNENPAVLDQRQLLTDYSPDVKKSCTPTELLMAARNENLGQMKKSVEGHSNENYTFPGSQNLTQRHNQIINQMIKDATVNNTFTYKNMVEEKNMKNQEISSRTEKSTKKRPPSSLTETFKKSTTRSPRPNSAQSRYMGTLKILDTKLPHDTVSNLETADAIRISIYQDWLQKKKHVLEEQQKEIQLKEQTEKEKKMEEEINKKEEATASFKAWKLTKKKTLIEAQEKKTEEEMKKERTAREKEEKKEIAKMAFEKWKEGKDQYLQNEFKKKKQAELEQKRKKEEEKLDKKKESAAAFKSCIIKNVMYFRYVINMTHNNNASTLVRLYKSQFLVVSQINQDRVPPSDRGGDDKRMVENKELRWQLRLNATYPPGLNEGISFMPVLKQRANVV